ncbi:uncharacterized protein LOC130798740 [Amaranthus tricolor]|uniref:uncharacterized protein LOC130798740 n=1 Tax=Amaranthus tricolor TaxID=29722 RepID=UPI002585F4C7|nr:uncharacterized protein LOC130798740 [Amaranthus tricolor]
MASNDEDEVEGAWYFGSNAYDPESSSSSDEEPQENDAQQIEQQHQRKTRLTNHMRHLILHEMLSLKVSDSLPHGTFVRIANKYGYTPRTIRNIWKRAIETKEENKPYVVDSKYKNCGRKRVQVAPNVLESKPMGERTCIRDVATCLDLAPTTVWRLIRRGEIKAHSNPLHPYLTNANKARRVEWILSLIQEDTIHHHPMYKGMYDFIHIDEKWFYLTKKTQRVYLAHKENIPYRAGKSSKFIPKAMFLGAVARPRWNQYGQCTFDGKIGIFPFISRVAAQRNSINRPRGSIEIKPTDSVTQEIYRSMLIEQLIPAILRKWPSDAPSIIFIQQDNARVHITNDDPIWQQNNRQGGLTFILTQQPSNSPDCNILDLGFFRSIQSLMHKKMPKNMNELIKAVEDPFEELHPKTLTNVWISLQHNLNEILKVKGSNDYVQPHLGKKVQEDNGRLRIQVRVPSQLVRECVRFLNPSTNQQGTQTENEDAAQLNQQILEAYDEVVEESQR